MEAFKGWLFPDGNRKCRAKPKASFTARRICRAVAKAELSEPTLVSSTGEDYQLKATPGINPEIRVCCPPHRKVR